MLSVLIPIAKEEPALVETLTALVPGVADGLVRDVALVSEWETPFLTAIADGAGCGLVFAKGDRLTQLAAGAAAARAEWVLVLEPGFVPGGLWMNEVADFVAEDDKGRAGVFSLAGRRGWAGSFRAIGFNLAATLGRAHPDHGLIAPKAALAQRRRLRIARLASPIHDRRARGKS